VATNVKVRTPEAEGRQVLRGRMSMWAKEDESSTGRVWAAGFHHVMALSRLVDILKLMNRLYLLNFTICLWAALNCG
jgi:hypothetical protein